VLLVGGCSVAAPCDWAVMVGLMPAPAVDDVRRRPSPNARPMGVRVAAPMGSPGSTLMTEGRYGLTSVIISKVRRSHNTAGGHRHTGPEPTAGVGGQAPTAGGHNTQHQNPPQGAGGGQQAPTAGGHNTAGRGGGQGGTTPRGTPAHKGAAPTRQHCYCYIV